MVVIELFCLCEIFACCVRYLTDGRNTPGTKSVPKVSPRIGIVVRTYPLVICVVSIVCHASALPER